MYATVPGQSVRGGCSALDIIRHHHSNSVPLVLLLAIINTLLNRSQWILPLHDMEGQSYVVADIHLNVVGEWFIITMITSDVTAMSSGCVGKR